MASNAETVSSGDTFPVKLHKLLTHAELTGKTDVVSWLPDGKSFKVHDKQRFALEIMPRFFSSSTYKSFQRSKNLWNFHTISKGVRKGECSHESFVRGNIDLSRTMVRVRTKPDDSDSLNEGPPQPASLGHSQGLGNLAQPSFLGSLSGSNPSMLLGVQQQQQLQQQQWQQQQQQLPSFSNSGNANHLLSALSGLGNGNTAFIGNLLSSLQMNTQTAAAQPSVQAPHISAIQQLLQATQQAPPVQPPPSSVSFNQQIVSQLLNLQQPPTGNVDVGNRDNVTAQDQGSSISVLSGATNPAVDVAKSAGGAKEKETSNKSNNDDDPLQKKRKDLREAAVRRGSKVVACRARGMPMEHNMHTAFLEIPRDAQHGMDLACSFPECRNGGIKFLYCLYCDDIIAKRTFRTHHAHEDLAGPQKNEEGEDGTALAANIMDNSRHAAAIGGGLPPRKRQRREADPDNDETHEFPAAGQGNGRIIGQGVHEIVNETSDSSSSPESANNDEKDNNGKAEPSVEVAQMRKEWDALLDQRQEMDSNDDISDWLDRVVATSERYKAASKKSKSVKSESK